jgi:hypothetical protein
MLDVRVFDVQSFHCAGQVEFHTSGAASLKSLPALGGRPVKSKYKLQHDKF